MSAELTAVHYRMYLLAYDTAAQRIYDRRRTAFLTRAGVLAELALTGAATEINGIVKINAGANPSDRTLSQTLREIESHDRSWKAWLRRSTKPTLDTTERTLLEMRLMRAAETRRAGIFPRRYLSASDPTIARQEQSRAHAVITEGHAPARDPRVAIAAAVGAIARVPTIASRRERAVDRGTATALLDPLSSVAPGLAAAIGGIRMTMIAAQGGMGGS